MDIFDRIAAGIALILAGAKKDAEDLLAHISAIDDHLSEDDTHNAAVDANLDSGGDDVTDENAHVDVVHAGLQKIIDATQTAAADTPAPSDTTAPTDTPAAS